MRVIAGSARAVPLAAPRGGATRPTSDLLKGAIFSALGERGCRGRVLDLYAGSGALGIEALSRGADWAIFVEANRAACRVIEANLRKCRLDDRATVYCLPVERALALLETPAAAQDGRLVGASRMAARPHQPRETDEPHGHQQPAWPAGGAGRPQPGETSEPAQSAPAAPTDAGPGPGSAVFDLVLLDPPYADARLDDVLEQLDSAPLLAPGAVILVEHAAARPLRQSYGPARWEKTRRHGDSAFSIYVKQDARDG